MKTPLNEEQTEAKAAAKKAKKQRQKAARQQTQPAQQAPPADHTQQEPQAQQHNQEAQHAQHAQQLDQEAQQAHRAQQAQQLDQEAQHEAREQQAKLLHGHEQKSQQTSKVTIHDLQLCCIAYQSAHVRVAAGHDQSHAAQSLPHCGDATEVQPAQTCGSADHELSASLEVNQSEKPPTGDALEPGRLDAAVETDATQTDGYLCDEASASAAVGVLPSHAGQTADSGTLFIMTMVCRAYADSIHHVCILCSTYGSLCVWCHEG